MRRAVAFAWVASSLAMAAANSGCSGCGHVDPSEDGTPSPSPTADPPVITALTPSHGPVGRRVVIDGDRFGALQGAGVVLFGSAVVDTVFSWSDTRIEVAVPDLFPSEVDVSVTAAGLGSNAVPFEVTLPPALYVNADWNVQPPGNQVFGFLIGTDGALSPMEGSPYPTGGTTLAFTGDLDTIRVHAPTRRLFATNRTSIAVFDVDPRTGELVAVAGSPFAVGGTPTPLLFGLAVTASGGTLYVADCAQVGVHGFAVSAAGALSELAGSPFLLAGGGCPDVPKMQGAGARLYVNDTAGKLYGFAVAADGTLTALDDLPVAAGGVAPVGLEASPDGRVYVPANFDGRIEVYDVAPDGAVTENANARYDVFSPNSLAFTRDGARLFALESGTRMLHVLDVGGDGSLADVPGSPFDLGGVALTVVAATRDGGAVYATSETAPNVRAFRVGSAGQPVELSGSPWPLSSASPNGIEVVP